MAKTYFMQFGSGDPRTYTGLSPTFLIFVNGTSGATIAAPALTESLTGSGIYKFTYGVTQPIAFLADAFTTSPGTAGRYVFGSIDPADRADEYGTTNMAIGTTNVAIGTTITGQLSGFGTTQSAMVSFLGTTASSIGSTSTDPSTVFGFLIRAREFQEGNRSYAKTTGILDYLTRGSSTLLVKKTVTDNSTGTTCI